MKIKKLIYHLYEKSLWNQIKNDSKPHHIGVILDGNRRYAREKGMDGTEGHTYGADKVEELLRWCSKLDIKIVTLFAFSTENFNRSEKEVSMLMGLLTKTLKKLQTDPLVTENKIRVRVIGKLEYLSDEMNKEIVKVEEQTKDNDSFLLNIALSYGGRTEIVDAVKKIAERVKKGDLAIEDINEDILAENLYTKGIPDP
ncbi:di-trans,poly-cis-decaprenylcistransferase, partial [bacterium]|nr:di-trans,poly-cis-decaprenylcistransferase [bacterium]